MRALGVFMMGVTAVALAVSDSSPAHAQACGAPTISNGIESVTCTSAGNPYADGIAYAPSNTDAVDVTLNSDVKVINSADTNTTAVGIFGTGSTILNANGATINLGTNSSPQPGATGLSAITNNGDALITSQGAITVVGGLGTYGISSETRGGGTATANYSGPGITLTGGTQSNLIFSQVYSGPGDAIINATGTFLGTLASGSDHMVGLFSYSSNGGAYVNLNGGSVTLQGKDATDIAALGTSTVQVTTAAGTSLTSTTSDGAGGAIYAESTGTANLGGVVTITSASTIDVTGVGGVGIWAVADADAPITISSKGSSLTVSGDDGAGILAESGSGTIDITSSGPIMTSGSDGYGIRADSGTLVNASHSQPPGASGAIAITVSALVSASGSNAVGIYSSSTTGLTTIKVTGAGIVEGTTSAIDVDPGTAGAAIDNAGVVQNLSGQTTAVAIMSAGGHAASTNAVGPTVITNGNLVSGTVDLGPGMVNTFTNNGVWNTTGGTNWFDGASVNGGRGVVDNHGTIIAAAAGATAPVTTTFNGIGTQSFNNAGLIKMQNGVVGDRTEITGSYVGIGGTVSLDTRLGADGSPSDMLVLDGGSASGSTALHIVNAGGPGAKTTADGIKVVDAINGATTTSTAFHLNAAAAAGTYDYGLYYGGIGTDANDQDWYLRTTGQLNPVAQTALPYADVLSNMAFATLGMLEQRTGNRVWPNGTPGTIAADQPGNGAMIYARGGPAIYGQGAWGRIAGQYSSYNPTKGSRYTQGIGFLQAGYEGTAYENGLGDLTLGSYASVVTSNAEIKTTPDPVTGAARAKGKITTTGYGVGVNVTWLGNDGFYADGIGQFTWYDSNLSNKTGNNNQGYSTALSLEVGRRFDLGSGWSVIPQAQLVGSNINFDTFTDTLGDGVKLGEGNSLKGRAGVRVENVLSWLGNDGQIRRLQLYSIANLTDAFLGGTKVQVAGASIEQQEKDLWGEVGLGGNYAWNDKWSLYGEADYATALSSHTGDDNYTLKGTLGLRYRW